MNRCMLSLCIPTNGIEEWVVPVLESIYAQCVEEEKYEVIVTDNGKNDSFRKKMFEYENGHTNFVYKKTDAKQFLNQIESFRLANGELIKFVNHRMLMKKGSVQYLIDFAEKNIQEKPEVFFSNGHLQNEKEIMRCNSFDQYVRKLSYWSSWSGGLACWKTDFSHIPFDMQYNELFPHTDILFYERNKDNYIIDNTLFLEEIPVGHASKGKYNLFYAFSVEYLMIICRLLEAKDICVESFLYIKDENEKLLEDLYWQFIVRKKECSYDLSDYRKFLDCYYGIEKIKRRTYAHSIRRLIKKIKK